MGRTSGGSGGSAPDVTATAKPLVNTHADLTAGVTPGSESTSTYAAHGAVTGTSNLLQYLTAAGTGKTIRTLTASSTETPTDVGGLVVRVPDGVAGART